jgi:hypothetical protein
MEKPACNTKSAMHVSCRACHMCVTARSTAGLRRWEVREGATLNASLTQTAIVGALSGPASSPASVPPQPPCPSIQPTTGQRAPNKSRRWDAPGARNYGTSSQVRALALCPSCCGNTIDLIQLSTTHCRCAILVSQDCPYAPSTTHGRIVADTRRRSPDGDAGAMRRRSGPIGSGCPTFCETRQHACHAPRSSRPYAAGHS